MMFHRAIEPNIRGLFFKGKTITLLGPRQSGKTTLSRQLITPFADEGGYFDCQLAEVRSHFVIGEPDRLLDLTKHKRIAVFDEAQTIQNIGSILKVSPIHTQKPRSLRPARHHLTCPIRSRSL